MKMFLEMIIKWLKDFGLKVNNLKTDLCLFYHSDTLPVEIEINGFMVKSNTKMNVNGIIFNLKLQWGPQIENAVKKSNKLKHAIMIIKKYFGKSEPSNLLT